MLAESMIVERILVIAAIAGTPVLGCATIFLYGNYTHCIYIELRSSYLRYLSMLGSIMGLVHG